MITFDVRGLEFGVRATIKGHSKVIHTTRRSREIRHCTVLQYYTSRSFGNWWLDNEITQLDSNYILLASKVIYAIQQNTNAIKILNVLWPRRECLKRKCLYSKGSSFFQPCKQDTTIMIMTPYLFLLEFKAPYYTFALY